MFLKRETVIRKAYTSLVGTILEYWASCCDRIGKVWLTC